MTGALKTAIVEALNNSPLARKIEREAREKVLADRRALATRRTELVAAHQKESPKLRRRLELAMEAAAKAQAQLRDAQQALRAAQLAVYGASATLQTDVSRVEADLRASADPSIDEAIRSLEDLWELTRRTDPPRLQTDTNILGRTIALERFIVSPAQRLESIRTAQRALEDLKLEPLDEQQLANAIDRVRASIPEVSVGPADSSRD
jgi:hypothetical protein